MISPVRLHTVLIALLLLASSASASAQTPSVVRTIAGGGPRPLPALEVDLFYPVGIAADSKGGYYISSVTYNKVFHVDDLGHFDTVAGTGVAGFPGDGGPAQYAQLCWPERLAVDGDGNLYISDTCNRRVRRVDARTAFISTVAGNGAFGAGGDGGPATQASLGLAVDYEQPGQLATDSEGSFYIADTGNNSIRRVNFQTGIIETVVGGPACVGMCLYGPRGLVINNADDLIFSFAGGGYGLVYRRDATTGTLTRIAGGGSGWEDVPATETYLQLAVALALDSAGNLYIADPDEDPLSGGYHRPIRRIDATSGLIASFAGNGYWGFSGDGGLAINAALGEATGVAVDAAGGVLIADYENGRVRRVDPTTGIINTVAFSPGPFPVGDGGPATEGRLFVPLGVCLDGLGRLVVADAGGHRVRRVDPSTGIITTVAGTGHPVREGTGAQRQQRSSIPRTM